MSRSPGETIGGGAAERALADRMGAAEDRSSRPEERGAAEPGFFDSLVALLKPRPERSLRQDFVEALRRTGDEPGGFTANERVMLSNILGLHEVRAGDIMVPRSEIEGVEITATLGELMERFEDSGRSRMPVYGEGLDDLLGMVHIRDVVGHVTRAALTFIRSSGAAGAGPKPDLDLAQVDLGQPMKNLGLLRDVLFVPPSMPASELMARMQAAHIQMALVIDEYGGTDGLVSLEDILEMVVGDIADEHDDEEVLVTAAGEGVFYADGRAELDDLAAVVGGDFDVSAFAEEADTLSGLIVQALGRVPDKNEVVEAVPGFELQVLDADPRRVKRVRIVRFPHDRVRRPDAAAPSSGER